jgi:shikimate kinase
MSVIILIGFMGCGKSTFGKKIARHLNYSFLDADDAIEKMAGLAVPEIFSKFGEAHFRKLEATFISSLKLHKNTVIATGGGMPCFGDNIEKLNNSGITFYLQRSALELAHRLEHANRERPLIKDKNQDELIQFIQEVLPQREMFYLQAQYILDRDQQTVDCIEKIISSIQEGEKYEN